MDVVTLVTLAVMSAADSGEQWVADPPPGGGVLPGGGPIGGSGGSTVSFDYDVRGRLIEVRHLTGAPFGVTIAYEYDDADNITRKRVTGA